MKSWRVVAVLDSTLRKPGFDFSLRQFHRVIRFARQDESPGLEEGIDHPVVPGDVREDLLQGFDAAGEALGVILAGGARLHGKGSVIAHRVGTDLEVLLGEEHLTGAFLVGIGKVAKDDVPVVSFLGLKPRAGVGVKECRSRIFKRSLMPLLHVNLHHVHKFFINVDHRGVGHRVVLEGLAEGRAFPTAANDHALWIGVKRHRRLAHTLMEDVLVEQTGLDVVVQEQALAEPRNFADLVRLVLGLSFEEHFAHSKLPKSRIRVRLGNKHPGSVA